MIRKSIKVKKKVKWKFKSDFVNCLPDDEIKLLRQGDYKGCDNVTKLKKKLPIKLFIFDVIKKCVSIKM